MNMTEMSLSPPLRDTLLEIGNVGASRAARRLSELLGEPIRVSAPDVALCQARDAWRRVESLATAADGNGLICVEQELGGDLRGRVSLLLPGQDARRLFHALPDLAGRAEQADALAEIGNILISSCSSAIADMLRLAIQVTPPRLVEIGRWREGLAAESPALLIHARLAADRRNLEGGLLLLLSTAAADQVMLAIQAQILAAD